MVPNMSEEFGPDFITVTDEDGNEFELEHLDEMGDLCRKKLIVEIMGKHSNIIFCNRGGERGRLCRGCGSG